MVGRVKKEGVCIDEEIYPTVLMCIDSVLYLHFMFEVMSSYEMPSLYQYMPFVWSIKALVMIQLSR